MENFIKNNKIINYLFVKIGSLVFKFFSIFVKVDDKKILFSSGMGNFIGDSPIYLYEAIKKDPRFKEFELIWAVKDVEKYQNDFDVVKIDTPKYFYHAFSSKIWITSVNIERGLNFKKKSQMYINTWHGIPLKYVGLDVAARNDYNFSQIDLFLTSGSYEEAIYKNAFNLKESQMKRFGLPRNIVLEKFTEDKRKEVLETLGLSEYENKKIILFAPTWKDYEYDKLDLNKLMSSISDEYILLMKSHPLEPFNIKGKKIVNVDYISDIPSLMQISDILISDYSSIMIDYSLLSRPIFAYIPDFQKYKETRGLYVDRQELAPNICNSVDELINFIINIDVDNESKKTLIYSKKYFDVSSVNSTEQVLRAMDKFLNKSKGP